MTIKIRLVDGTTIECSNSNQATEILLAMGKEQAPRSGAREEEKEELPTHSSVDTQPEPKLRNRFSGQGRAERTKVPLGQKQLEQLKIFSEALSAASPKPEPGSVLMDLTGLDIVAMRHMYMNLFRFMKEYGKLLPSTTPEDYILTTEKSYCKETRKCTRLWSAGPQIDSLINALSKVLNAGAIASSLVSTRT